MVTHKSYPRASLRDYGAYIKNCEKGYPKWIFWEIIAGPKQPDGKFIRLTYAQQQDLVFDERDYRIRGLTAPEGIETEK